MAIYSVWSIITSMEIIVDAVKNAQVSVSENFFDILNFLFGSNNGAAFFAYALLLAAAGLILQVTLPKAARTLPVDEGYDDEYDDWLDEMEPVGDGEAEEDADAEATEIAEDADAVEDVDADAAEAVEVEDADATVDADSADDEKKA